MKHKMGIDKQLWLLEASGCLRVKSHMNHCLGVKPYSYIPTLVMENGRDFEHWKFENSYLVNQGGQRLSLNVIWALRTLTTNGARVDVRHQRNTMSMRWKMVDM